MSIKNHFLLFTFIVSAVISTGCKKNNNEVTEPVITDKSKDSVVIYSKETYLWYEQIPDNFDGKKYADQNEIMEALRQYSVEAGFTQPVDRFSFASTKVEWDNISNGIGGDFGLGIFFFAESDLRVKSVEKESPAGVADIRRGWRITNINGNTDITTANMDFVRDKVFNSGQTSFTFQKPDGTSVDITLNTKYYNTHAVYLDTIYNINSKKAGYLIFNSFLGDTTEMYNEFERVFNNFAKQNVTDVIIDLRYNGGGYVSAQEKLANYLAPSSANGGSMMTQQYNNKLSQYNRTTKFRKIGALNMDHVFFIVSKGTASASELLINNLKPYMNVKLIGPSHTYGKPVGFFPFSVGDWYIFPVSFRTVNKNGEGNYYNGLEVNNQVIDGLDKDWGDIKEASLASTLKYISTGIFSAQRNAPENNSAQVNISNKALDAYSFKGSVGTH